MVDENYRELLERILELVDTACQASLELLERYTNKELELTQTLLADLRAAVQAIGTAYEPILPQLDHAHIFEMLENVEETLDEIQRSIEAGNQERAAMKMEFQLFPFLRCLREAFYFWGMIYPDKERMDRYYQEEFAAHYQNFYVHEGEPAPFRLSIVVTGYNHLKTTKKCVEQLLKETDFEKLNAELILIDHGSKDGTLEYFESLGVGKIIHFKRNVRMYMFATLFLVCQGEYFSFVSNDILVTRDWANILFECLRSDPRIIAAVPATPNIANLQMLYVPTNDPNEFISWANGQNQSDPSKWSDRARLMPPLGIYRTSLVNSLGFADPYFYSMEFWDDDFSLRARRAGYRQLVCGDVACYHFGSVTGKEAQQKENTLVYGRELFMQKNGVDAWGIGCCYDYQAVQLLLKVLPVQGDITMLGLDCGMGDTPLQIKNELRHLRRNCQNYQLTSQQEYLPDLEPCSEQAYFVPNLAEGLSQHFEGTDFHGAYLGRDIGQYENCAALLEVVSNRLAPGGWLVFYCENPFYAVTLHQLLQLSMPTDMERYILPNPAYVKAAVKRYFSQVQVIAVEQTVNGLDEFAVRYFGNSEHLTQIIQRLKEQRYYFVCRK